MKNNKITTIVLLFIVSVFISGCTPTTSDDARYHFFTTASDFPSGTYRVYVNQQNLGTWTSYCTDATLCIDCSEREDYPNVSLGIGTHDIEVRSKASNYFTVVGSTTITVEAEDLGECQGIYLY